MANAGVPIVDLGTGDKHSQAEEICQAFRSWGFVHLLNHGVPEKVKEKVFEMSKTFFQLSVEQKSKWARKDNENNHGWVALERESLNPSRPADFKEAFNISYSSIHDNLIWPEEDIPHFRQVFEEFINCCTALALRILHLMGVGLKLQDEDFFVKCHNIQNTPNATTLRTLFYPPVSSVKANQVRCGEHSDYGSITLLFQDTLGGLQVVNRTTGVYVDVLPVPNSVLVNVGDLMQQWTNDEIISTKHRVLVPEEEARRQTIRQSLAFFVHPDDDVIIECLDGSDKYPPITARNYLLTRFKATYL